MMKHLYNTLEYYKNSFHTVVPFNTRKDRLLKLDFTSANKDLGEDILLDTTLFSQYINKTIGSHYSYGIGGYNEHRTIYSRSNWFDGDEEPRRLHLGVDIWGKAGTPVYAPLDGYVHSFAFNNHFGDYGATIILKHQVNGVPFHTLYGHLSLVDIQSIHEDQYIRIGEEFAHFGQPEENGFWPPHLHFQIVEQMNEKKGDYSGVCKFSERNKYLLNSPDPDVILSMMEYAVDR